MQKVVHLCMLMDLIKTAIHLCGKFVKNLAGKQFLILEPTNVKRYILDFCADHVI